jgi:hypothetical protein
MAHDAAPTAAVTLQGADATLCGLSFFDKQPIGTGKQPLQGGWRQSRATPDSSQHPPGCVMLRWVGCVAPA